MPNTRLLSRPVCQLAALALVTALATAQAPVPVPAPAPAAGPDWRLELLEVAWRAASAPPVDPHAKTRARLQADVVAAGLRLDRPALAQQWLPSIDGWRRGVGHAELGAWFAEHGDRAAALAQLQLADQQAEEQARRADVQEWPRERILARIAAVHLRLGDDRRADAVARDLSPAQLGDLPVLRAERRPADAFAAELAGVDTALATHDFDRTMPALRTCVALFRRDHQDADRRHALAARVLDGKHKLPVLARIELLAELAEAALATGHRDDATVAIDALAATADAARWQPGDHIPVQARVAVLRHRLGDTARARELLVAAQRDYDRDRATVVDIYRAGILRRLAEAQAATGDQAGAAATWRRATEEGVVNPNARPRAEDLVATCLSLAANDHEPAASLRTRLRQIQEGLAAPW